MPKSHLQSVNVGIEASRDVEQTDIASGAAQSAGGKLTGDGGGIVHAVIEPYVLPVSPYEAFTSGQQNDVPLLIGSNADEARALTDASHVKAATFDSDIDRFVAGQKSAQHGRCLGRWAQRG